ncbi:MAG TPA: cysteine--tRNA ligase, partial [Candidatus Limnocylindria bacterium]|nr:cysteine--tRNA ligase [Candidatus Limnocylindria bacterium]
MYDTARRAVVPFEPMDPARVRVYDCGPTVWDFQHIGNLYRYIVADVARRALEYFGYGVTQVMNITDVGAIMGDVDEGEDRMAIAARREGADPLALAKRYTEQFFVDRRKLNIVDPHVVSKATEHVPEMIALIARLIEKGNAYVAPDGVYFDVTTFPGYGTRLSPEDPTARKAGARIEPNPNKRHPADFALWRGAKAEDLQRWDSPWGPGKPGWHIECSAMSMKYLGETFDIHSGGEDHVFPHHECEIAQSEAATGKPFVRYWMHVRFLTVEGEGMHKSIGNTYLLRDIEEWGFQPLAFRMLALGTSYRKPLAFTRQGLGAAQNRLDRWRRAIAEARAAGALPAEGPPPDDEALRAFRDALANDLNTPVAVAAAERAIDRLTDPDPQGRAAALAVLLDMDRVLGLSLGETATEPELS